MRLGRLVNHDPRSRNFPAATVTELRTVAHRHYGGSLDQGQLGSCTGNALAHARNTVPIRHGRPLLTEADAVKVYSKATTIDPWDGSYPPEDTGSSGLAACKAAQSFGMITGYNHAFGLDQALAALVLSPIMVGINWYEDMFTPGPAGFVHPTGDLAGGHEFCVVKINVEYRYVGCVNSWGNDWGLEGRFRLSFRDFGTLLAQDGDVIVPVSN